MIGIERDLEAVDAHSDGHDPWVDPEEADQEPGFPLTTELRDRHYDAIIIAVAHYQFRDMGIECIRALCK